MTRSILHRDQLSDSLAVGLAALLFILPLESSAAGTADPAAYSRPLTLHECIGIALGESPALEASRYEVLAAGQEVRAEQGKALPNLSGAGGPEVFSGNPTNKFAVVNAGNTNAVGVSSSRQVGLGTVEIYTARLRYPVFKDGSILGLNNAPAIAEKKAKKQALSWTVNLTRQEVVYRIIDEFITTVSARNRMGLAARRVKLLEQSVDMTEEQEKQGLKLPIDLKVAQDQLNGARGLAKLLREQAVAGSLELSRSLGLPSSSRLSLASTLPEPPYPPPTAEELLGASLSHHPSLERQRALIDEAKQDYRLERFRLYPSIYLDGSAIYLDDFGSNNASVYAGTLTVSVPIFDFGAQLATARSKLMKYKAEEAKLLSTADDVTYEILKAYRSIYILTHNILSLQDDISKIERDVQVMQSQQQQGIAEPLTVIEKELHLLARQDDLQGLEARRLTLYAYLQKEAGGAWTWIP
jgi:outer membrane protein, multidrug efflux system